MALNNLGANPQTFTPFDSNYQCPSKAWVLDVFSDSLNRSLYALGLVSWKTEAWDCDKFARLAAVLGAIEHARTPWREQAALALGVFCYVPAAGPHAINFAVVDPHTMEIVWLEPQTQKEVKLTEDEIGTCYNVMI
jgi:hypothetical protein